MTQDRRTVLENSLAEFFKEAWNVLEPGRKLSWSWHYDLICEHLYMVREGRVDKKYVGIAANVPPRTGKSSLITVCFPVWCWTTQPDKRFLCGSYAGELATEHSIKRRDLIKSSWFQNYWGKKFRMKIDQNVKDHFDNDKTGSMASTSVGGSGTGRGGDVLILDDPLNAEQALSDTERKSANDWIDNTVRSRLNDPSSGLIIMVMQRLHELDCTGYVLAGDPGAWIHLKLPLEAEEREVWKFPISGHEIVRQPGDVLQPDRYPASVINKLKVKRLTWASQYQQRPAPLEGNLIRRSEVKYYGGVDPLTGLQDEKLPAHFDITLVSIDCAFKDLATSDFVAIGKIGVKGGKRYVLNVINAHLDLDATEVAARRECTATPNPSAVLVEDKANGSSVIRRLKKSLKGEAGISGVIAINPEGGKIARMFAMSPEWQAGDWYVDRTAAWAEPFISQLLTFPNAVHDDMVDMSTQASIWLQAKPVLFEMGSVTRSGSDGTGEGSFIDADTGHWIQRSEFERT